MIYAFIIVIALAIAFIVLIRRLPEAIELAKQDQSTATTAPSFQLPKLPKLIKFPRADIKRTTQDKPAPPKTINKPAFQWPQFNAPKINLPKFSLPKQPVNTVRAPAEPVTNDTSRPHEFWTDLEQAKSVAEPILTETAPKNEPIPSFRSKAKNLNQEADDLFAIKDYRKAEKLYLKLATEDPTNPKIYSRLGIIYLEQKNYEDARDAFQQAIKFEPGVASRHFNLAISYLNLGSPAKAMHSLEQALKYDPANRKYRKMLDDVKAGRV